MRPVDFFPLRHPLAGTIVATLLVGTAEAQTVEGTVRAPDSTVVAGAIVVGVRDGRDTVRTISSARGRFVLRAPGPGRTAITVHRIGFRPAPAVTLDLQAGETRPLALVASGERVQLPVVSTARDRGCRSRSEGGALVAEVWEEARKALDASLLAAEAGPIRGRWLEHRGTLAPDLAVVREQSVAWREHPTTQVFRSVAPADLATRGFVVQGLDTLAFLAPDPRVLLSAEFAATHCFALQGSAGDSLIGIAFTPRESPAPGLTAISGEVWLARADAVLRRVRFEYHGAVEAADRAQREGEVAFMRLADGRVVVTDWRARLPIFAVRRADADAGIPGTTRITRRDTTVRLVHEAGGQVLTLTGETGPLLERPAPVARVRLLRGAAGDTVAGSRVLVAGTNVVATADSTGLVEIGPLPAGRYAATVRVPAADSIGAEPVAITVQAALAPRTDTLRLPAVATMLERLCGKDNERGVLLRGTVRNADGERVKNARVTLVYLRTDARLLKAGRIEQKPETARASSDLLGDWRLCGVPRGTDLLLAVEGPDGDGTRERFRIDPARLSARRDVVLAPTGARALGFDGPLPTADAPTNIALAGRSPLGEFDSRHQRGEATQSLSRPQILDRHAVQTWQLIAGMRGARVIQSPSGNFAVSGRGDLPSLMSPGTACPFVVVLDGVRLVPRTGGAVDLNELPAPERLHGIELYAGGTRLPALYATLGGGAFCGVIGVWSER